MFLVLSTPPSGWLDDKPLSLRTHATYGRASITSPPIHGGRRDPSLSLTMLQQAAHRPVSATSFDAVASFAAGRPMPSPGRNANSLAPSPLPSRASPMSTDYGGGPLGSLGLAAAFASAEQRVDGASQAAARAPLPIAPSPVNTAGPFPYDPALRELREEMSAQVKGADLSPVDEVRGS